MATLKIDKKQDFNLSLELTFFKNPQVGGSEIDFPWIEIPSFYDEIHTKLHVPVWTWSAISKRQSNFLEKDLKGWKIRLLEWIWNKKWQ